MGYHIFLMVLHVCGAPLLHYIALILADELFMDK